MSEELDLNADNYSINELEKLLNITRPYAFELIQINAIKLKKKISELSLQKRKENQLDTFIKDIINILERNYITKYLKKINVKQKKIEEKLNKILEFLTN